MQVVSRLCVSADGYVTTPDGWPAQLADPTFEPWQSHGINEFLEGKEAALMGRTTFEPALDAADGPGPTSTCSCRHRNDRTAPPTTSSPTTIRSGCSSASERRYRGGDVHLIGGPRTIQTYRALGALDRLELVVLPLLLGDGMRLTPALSPDAALRFEHARALPGGSVEIGYSCA